MAIVLEDILKIAITATIGGIIDSWITTRFERWKAWKAYDIVKIEMDGNLQALWQMYVQVVGIYKEEPTQTQVLQWGDKAFEQKNLLINMVKDLPNHLPLVVINLAR